MKVGVLGGNGVELVDRPEPEAGPGELVVELAACGVCGTDLEKVRGNYKAGGILGHEPVGRIAEVGAGLPGFRVGERVFVHHHVPCYACEVCRRGEYTYCPTYGRTNLDPGGFSERFRVPKENVSREAVLKLHDEVSWDVGTLLEPAGCALTALRKVGFRDGDSVFLVGLGPVGLLYAALARSLGARWIGGSDLSKRRREAASKLGVDLVVDPAEAEATVNAVNEATGNAGVDLAVAAVGVPAAIRSAARLPRRGGTLNLFGLPERGSRLDHDLQDLYLRGIRILPTYATTEPDIAEVHRRVAAKELLLEGLVSHRLGLDSIREAFSVAGRANDSLKVVVTGPAFDQASP